MRQVKPGTLYTSPFSMAYWRDAAAELRDTRILVFAALMIALRVALKSLGIPIAADLKINIAFFVNAPALYNKACARHNKVSVVVHVKRSVSCIISTCTVAYHEERLAGDL